MRNLLLQYRIFFWNEEKDHADIIHAMDMREAGYKNIVVRQEKQWVMMEK